MATRDLRVPAEGDHAPPVQGVLHLPQGKSLGGIVLTHGAGGDKDSLLLVALCEVFAAAGLTALRCDLPFRQRRPKGPPSPSLASLDRRGLRAALEALAEIAPGRLYVGGSSYGGRQASILAADALHGLDGLLLLSYPLHPPGKPDKLRTEHFPKIAIPSLFVHGTRDAFGTIEEMRDALTGLGGPTRLLPVDGARHGLIQAHDGAAPARRLAEAAVAAFLAE